MSASSPINGASPFSGTRAADSAPGDTDGRPSTAAGGVHHPADAVTVVLPCLNERLALPWILERMPTSMRALVADNGSTDGSPGVARQFGAGVVHAPIPGYGSACHAGIEAAPDGIVAVMDCDATFDPQELTPLVAAVATGSVDMAVCRRRPRSWKVWPWHARLGTGLLAFWLRRTTPLRIHDLPPVRVFQRAAYLQLDLKDRGFAYPMETMATVGRNHWRVVEFDMDYRTRVGHSKVAGTLRGSLRATVALLHAAPRRRARAPQAPSAP